MIGRVLSKYEIVAEIGRGGMGVVYRAIDRTLQREVALKVLSPELTGNPELRRRLLREARAAASLNHPAITVVHAVEEAEGVTFVAMELVRGEALEAVLTREPPTTARALDLALEVAEALAEGHEHSVVHRDLKPGNVMVTDSGHAKIVDFGLAKHLTDPSGVDSGRETANLTEPGKIVGTAAYMAPEQARGRPVDPRTDIFSFGVLLFEMLSGRRAFQRASGLETLHAVLTDPAPRLPELGLEGVRPELQRLVDKCVEKEPDSRYQTVKDLIVDLRSVRRQIDAAAASPRGAEESPAAARRRASGKLGVIVVDDEEPARAILREYLAEAEGVEVLAECRNGFEAVKAVADLAPDVVFLDIQMPKLNGFEVVELIGADVTVVFVTAFDEHAVRAFEVNAVDYLLKPVGPERFAAALDKARKRRSVGTPTPVSGLLASVRGEGQPLNRILVRQGPRVDVIPADKLDYAEAQDDYVSLRTEVRALLKQQTMAELEESLDASRFIRIHRSYLLNLDRLAKIDVDARDNRVAVLVDGTRLPISRAGYSRLKTLL